MFARLFVLTLMPVTKREYPSTKQWITNFHRIKPERAGVERGVRDGRDYKTPTVLPIVMDEGVRARDGVLLPDDAAATKDGWGAPHTHVRLSDAR